MFNKNILSENIIKVLGIEDLADDKKVALLEKMTELIQKRITLRVLEKMTKEQQEEFGRLVEANNSEKAAEFMAVVIPNMPEIMEEEIVKFKQEAKDFVGSLDV